MIRREKLFDQLEQLKRLWAMEIMQKRILTPREVAAKREAQLLRLSPEFREKAKAILELRRREAASRRLLTDIEKEEKNTWREIRLKESLLKEIPQLFPPTEVKVGEMVEMRAGSTDVSFANFVRPIIVVGRGEKQSLFTPKPGHRYVLGRYGSTVGLISQRTGAIHTSAEQDLTVSRAHAIIDVLPDGKMRVYDVGGRKKMAHVQ